PRVNPTRQIDQVVVACLAQRRDQVRAAHAGVTEHYDRLIARDLLPAGVDLAHGDIPRAVQAADLKLEWLAHVQQDERLARVQPRFDLVRRLFGGYGIAGYPAEGVVINQRGDGRVVATRQA